MPVCYQLVGVPGAGKSTWLSNQTWVDGYVIVSTDDHVEQYAGEQGKTYDEVFKEYMSTATRLMTDAVVAARDAGKNIIWDQTSVSVKSRRKKFNMLPDYEHIAVVFLTPEADELHRRLKSRPGKNIPRFVMQQMINNFEMPTIEEGFREVWLVG